jgi:hypothetical protein
MPDNLRQGFDLRIFSKEDLQENTPFTESPFILITNWHQLMDTSRQKEITLAEDIGIESRDATVSQRVERFMDFLTYNGDLMVINDEAHHVHNASDAEQKRWQKSIEELREKIKLNKDQLFIEKSSLLSNKIESLPESEKLMVTAHRDETNKPVELSEVQKHMIDIGLAKLDALQNDFNKFKTNKKPVMFVMADMNQEADMIAEYIRQKTDSNTDTDTKRKAIAASERCLQISRIRNIPYTVQPRTWNYVLLPQNVFEEMDGNGLHSLIEKCEANLALLKMRKE